MVRGPPSCCKCPHLPPTTRGSSTFPTSDSPGLTISRCGCFKTQDGYDPREIATCVTFCHNGHTLANIRLSSQNLIVTKLHVNLLAFPFTCWANVVGKHKQHM